MMTNIEHDADEYALGESPKEVRQSQLAQMEEVLAYTRRLLCASPDDDELRLEYDAMMANIEKVRMGIHVPDPVLEDKAEIRRQIRAEFPSLEAWCNHANEAARREGFRVIDSLPSASSRARGWRRGAEAAD